ncbi:hypothetical protein C8F04DRAFT_1138204 [Mycena alexandri]|uniref:PARP catalytic domain-containing protein n=1 Tax=Mycena alexandri TaxID=1745969 RepID=A0AAD6S754_9AGAR|nr:hypothetical protein C8F04DRAFT_1138204 [Mycena alexandri]
MPCPKSILTRLALESTIIFARPEDLILFDLTEEVRDFAFEISDNMVESYEEDEEEDLENANDEFIADQRISDPGIIRGHMGSVTIESIMKDIQDRTRLHLLHAECVIRADLRKRFMQMKSHLQAKGRREHHGRRSIVFHGTPRQNVGSIVSSGFVVPGNPTRAGQGVEVRYGTTWGQGIYTSPDPCYSLSYTDDTRSRGPTAFPGQKLIVCSVLMGKRHDVYDYRRYSPEVEEGYDSHVSPSELEYVVFEGAQVLPLFVLHLTSKAKWDLLSMEENKVVPDLVLDKLRAGLSMKDRRDLEVARRKNLTQLARKYLPNGFGPARGDKFVVEEMAPVDDDEEMWGDFQDPTSNIPGEFQYDRVQSFWNSSW